MTIEEKGVRDRYGQKTQEYCPRCRHMYCEGFWGEGLCIKDMYFCGEPTSDYDEEGRILRAWYEVHRETWWDRNKYSKNQELLHMGVADNFMLSLLGEVHRIKCEKERQLNERNLAVDTKLST